MHTRTTLTRLIATALLLVVAPAALAQDLTPTAPAQSGPMVVMGLTVHTVSGETIENGLVAFVDGEIVRVGPSETTPVPRGARILDFAGEGLHAYPGLIGANTLMGLMEIGAIRATLDHNEVGALTPEVRASISVNPDSTIIPVTRTNGVLTVAVLPSGGAVPGRASVIRMDGWTTEDLTIDDDAGLIINWPSMRIQTGWWVNSTPDEQRQRMRESVERIDEAFNAAEHYLAEREADQFRATDLRWEAMRGPIQNGDRLLVRANELDQIRSAVNWATGRGLKLTIVGGDDAPACADLLKRHDVWVIVTGTHRLPGNRDDDYDAAFRVPAELEAAGVTWCLASNGGSFETPHERNLPYHAATAVAYGLDPDVAIRSITLSAAEVLGVADEIGSLEAGKAATMIITDGDPLEMSTNVELAFIDGRAIDLENKQTVLAAKYREKYRQLGLLPPAEEAPDPAME